MSVKEDSIFAVFYTGANVRGADGFGGLFSSKEKAEESIKKVCGNRIGKHYTIVPVNVDDLSDLEKLYRVQT